MKESYSNQVEYFAAILLSWLVKTFFQFENERANQMVVSYRMRVTK